MADTLTREQRHIVMSHIRSKNTRPEMLVRRFLHHHGIRYSLHVRRMPGSPDLVLRRYRTAIYVNGCFWHGHSPCTIFRMPSTNVEFWTTKIDRNRQRDAQQHQLLLQAGWHVIVIWECQLRTAPQRQQTLNGLLRTLNQIELQNLGVHHFGSYDLNQEDLYSARAAEDTQDNESLT